MKEILITNDDGFEAAGLLALRDKLRQIANVTVVAPSSEKSACAHSITLTRPLRFIQLDDGFFKLDDATPSDCIYLALETMFKHKKPDLVISGINHGANVGEDITYSGTCGGAMEGTLQGVNSIAVSQLYNNDSLDKFGFDLACEITLELVQNIFENGYPLDGREFLNLNIPAVSKNEYKGLKIVPVGQQNYNTNAQIHRNPRGLEYYWLGTPGIRYAADLGYDCDITTLNQNYASLTPIKLDMTSYKSIEILKNWTINER
ncbi:MULTISPECIES: 5'/3'-nucleotidase SurE [Campylobacter]|uniref:5'-nucleotidase SurE n=1 Tax=Campylobacter vicugnae TaxID=1660076 RepID=A0A1X9SZQ9_9BACT|nr:MULTISPECIES: 5'/3'-nucleotidase SurE [Campylobacter]MCR8690387.1 5'/3'-nucleotidase SurE [Campylobacter sp. RM9264]MCR8701247.1 5'/3'-nucleotidase SurE [Campylobacter sp. RM12176]ARR01685.1 broad specificity 5'(3')-nucleotidase and polyphosphatase [Campylobacter sp. RM8964]ARR03409.1 broad specificity 5'(3')-nucleotidase and polyphosphatase [Campylobacter sp. RM12175]MBO5063862.1 5'/3'-nucleotidase SurE [Campylobacter sp.]